jgi:hypothetical protein
MTLHVSREQFNGSIPPHSKVLLFAYYYPPQNLSGAERPARLAKYLPEFGYEAVPITADCATEESAAHHWSTSAFGKIGWAIERFLLPHRERLPWVPFAVAEAARLRRQHAPVAIISTSPPITTSVAALLAKVRFGIPWIADFRDPLHGNPFRSAVYDSLLERAIFRHADHIIANTDAVAEGWRARYPQHRHKITTVWNGFDPEQPFGPAPLPERPCRLLAHVGGLYGGRTPKVLIDALERLFAAGALHPGGIRVEFTGQVEEHIRDHCRPLIDRGLLSAPGLHLPKEDAARAVAEADYLLLIDTNATGASLQLPAKIFDYIRAGRPILAITNENSPTHRILVSSGVPNTCIFPADAPAVVDGKVIAFFAQPSTPVRASEWFWQTFDGKRQAETVARLITALRRDSPAAATLKSMDDPAGR